MKRNAPLVESCRPPPRCFHAPVSSGQHADGARRGAAVLRALDAVVEADGRGLRGGVLTSESADFVGGHAGPGGDALGRVLAGALGELLRANGVLVDIGAVFETFGEDDVHHAERERGVGAGMNGDVPVGEFRGAGLIGIDDDEACAGAACFFDLRPEMNAVAVNVRAPGDDQARAMKLLGIGAELAAVDREDGVAAGGGADGAIELRGAEPVEEAAIHGAVAEHADGAGVGVGQDGFGAVLFGDRGETLGDGVEGFVPGDALEALGFASGGQRALGDAGAAAHGIEQPIGRVDAIEIAATLPQRNPRVTGWSGVAGDLLRASAGVDAHQNGAGVRAVMRADGVDHAQWRFSL